MATFFGEVVHPSSRVFYDSDCEDEEESQQTEARSQFEVKEFVKGALNKTYNLVIITEGFVARGFADLYLRHSSNQRLAEISLVSSNDAKPKAESSYVISLNENTILLDISRSIDLVLANSFTLKIRSLLETSKNVIILSSQSLADYRCSSINDLPPSFLRTLTSTKSKQICTLEQPNFISGLSASVLSYREVLGNPWSLYICYTDTPTVDSITIEPFVNTFQKDPAFEKIIMKRNQESRFGASVDQSFMYM